MTTRVYLARHGATTSTAANLFAGSSNPPLSEAGIHEVTRLSERLASVDLSAAFCSDKDRAVKTATIICQPHHGMKPLAVSALREIDHGHWEGKDRDFVEAHFGDEYAKWENDPAHFAPQGGETGQSVVNRALPALRKIVADYAGKSVLVVSHTGTNRLLLCALLGVDLSRYRDRFGQDLACLNILEFDGDDAKLCLMNDTSHYAKTISLKFS